MKDISVCQECITKLDYNTFGLKWDVSWAGKCDLCGYTPTRENGAKLTFHMIPMEKLTMMAIRNLVK